MLELWQPWGVRDPGCPGDVPGTSGLGPLALLMLALGTCLSAPPLVPQVPVPCPGWLPLAHTVQQPGESLLCSKLCPLSNHSTEFRELLRWGDSSQGPPHGGRSLGLNYRQYGAGRAVAWSAQGCLVSCPWVFHLLPELREGSCGGLSEIDQWGALGSSARVSDHTDLLGWEPQETF